MEKIIPESFFDENYSLWLLMHQSRDALIAARAKELQKLGLSSVENRVLVITPIIKQTSGGKATASDLSRWIFRKPSSISTLLKRMEKKGLIQRTTAPHDNKSILINLTEKGEKLREQVYKKGCFIDTVLSSLSEEERHQLWITMGKLRSLALKELGLSKKPPFPQFI
jgi:DNA-binding MarR family transcriptional regulator